MRSRSPLLVTVALAFGLLSVLVGCGDGGSGGSPAPTITGAAAKRGQALAKAKGCTGCHTDDGGRSTGPTWAGVAGTEVTLDGGEKVIADADYLTRAIVDPRSEVVAGFTNIMPTAYGDDLSAEEVADLVAYLQELSPEQPPG